MSTSTTVCGRLTDTTSVVPMAKRQTCIEALADGWIGAPDLCSTCTAAFMAALDGIAGPLSWHQAYRGRAGR